MTKKLSHIDARGQAKMVNVGAKSTTQREAVAEAYVLMQGATLRAIAAETLPKGEVLSTARLAGILAAKRTSELIPLCHSLNLDSIEVDFDIPTLNPKPTETVRLRIKAAARISAKTGVEMEALTAVSVAALTIYDMCKAIDKAMTIEGVRLLKKTGGKSGTYTAPPAR